MKATEPATVPEVSKKSKPAAVTAKSIWFYTAEGERVGPVTFEELRVRAAASSLDPRLDMVWKKDMDSWKPAGQIDGLFERRNVPVEAKPAPAPPTKSLRLQKQTATARLDKVTAWPGARRRSLWFAAVIFPVGWHYAFAAASPLLVKEFGDLMMGRFLPLAPLIPLGVLVWFVVKRLMNLGMSRLWGLALFAPILNLWLGYRLLVCPAGYAYHKKMDAPGLALAVPCCLVGLSCVLTVLAFIALSFGAIKSPTIEGQLRNVLRVASKAIALT